MGMGRFRIHECYLYMATPPIDRASIWHGSILYIIVSSAAFSLHVFVSQPPLHVHLFSDGVCGYIVVDLVLGYHQTTILAGFFCMWFLLSVFSLMGQSLPITYTLHKRTKILTFAQLNEATLATSSAFPMVYVAIYSIYETRRQKSNHIHTLRSKFVHQKRWSKALPVTA